MRRPSAITAILLGLVLIPTCVLAYMGFFAADALDAAEVDRLRRELDAGERWVRSEAPQVGEAIAIDVQAALERAAAHLAQRLPHLAPEAMRQEIDAAVDKLRLSAVGCVNGRLVREDGTPVYPVPFDPEAGPSDEDGVDLESLLGHLRRAADRAYYGGGGAKAAVALWRDARDKLRTEHARAVVDVEIARLAARTGQREAVQAAFTQVRDGLSADVRARVRRPWVLLALSAAGHMPEARAELRRLLEEGHVDVTPLTTRERSQVIWYGGRWQKTATGSAAELHPRAWRYDEGLVTLRAPVHADVQLVVDMPVRRFRSVLFARLVRQRSVEPLRLTVLDDRAAERWAPGGSRHAERVREGLPSTAIVEIAQPAGFRTSIAVTNPHVGLVGDERTSRRRFIVLGVVALVLITLLGLVLVRRGIARERAARRMRDEFIANVTHEVRTPLTSVLLHSQMMAEEDVADDQRKQHAEVVQAQGRRLAALVDDMLDFARLERGTRSLEAVPVDVGAACREAVAPYLVLAEQDGAEVACHVEGAEVAALGDPAALARILGNLIGNAWKHGRPSRGGGPGRIRVLAREEDAHAVVEVRDDGPGIPAEERERVFERFGRGRRSTRIEGSGIGLALSRDLAEALGGDLEALDDGEETIFRLRLPTVPELEWED